MHAMLSAIRLLCIICLLALLHHTLAGEAPQCVGLSFAHTHVVDTPSSPHCIAT